MNSSLTRTVTGLALVAATIAAAGCGGSSHSSTGSSTAEFTRAANRVCTTINDRIAALPKPTTLLDVVPIAAKEIDLAREGTAELKALRPPVSEKAQWGAYLAQLDDDLSLSTRLLRALEARDLRRARQIQAQAVARTPQRHAAAAKLGLSACANAAQPGGARSG